MKKILGILITLIMTDALFSIATVSVSAKTTDKTYILGDVDMDGSARNLKFGSASGDLCVRCDGSLQSVTANTGSGDVDLTLAGITGMEITTKVQSGDVEIHWQNQNSCVKNATSTFGDGSCKVQVKTGAGDVCVTCR